MAFRLLSVTLLLSPWLKGGEKVMGKMPRELEVQRLVNVASAFEWKKEKEEVVGNYVKITLVKEILDTEAMTEATPT